MFFKSEKISKGIGAVDRSS